MNKNDFEKLKKNAQNEAWLRHMTLNRWLSINGIARSEWYYISVGRKPRKAISEKLEKLQGGYKK